MLNLHPLVLAYFGSCAHESGYPNLSVLERGDEGGELDEGDAAAELETSRDIGITGVLGHPGVE